MDLSGIAALVPLAALIGGGFGWLIKLIVDQSKEAVDELRKANERREVKLEAERDEAKLEARAWRDRAYACGWKEDE